MDVISWGEVGLAAAIATMLTTSVRHDLRRWRRNRHRRRGTGPYEPTHELPRDVDMALAIADHLRLVYRPLVEFSMRAEMRGLLDAINHAHRISLRAAVTLARALNQEGSTT